jgi:hypothetical protein
MGFAMVSFKRCSVSAPNGLLISIVSSLGATLGISIYFSQPVLAIGKDVSEVKVLKPDGGMPLWYYNCERLFRYPIPTNFDFAYIDTSGKVVITAPFNLANDFYHNVAVVNLGHQGLKDGKLVSGPRATHLGYSAIVASDGKITPLYNLDLKIPFYDELAVAYFNRQEPGAKNFQPSYDLIDKSGKKVTNFQWKEAKEFSEGLAAVKGDEPTPEAYDGLWGYHDKANKTVIAAKFHAAERFSEGLAAVSPRQVSLGMNPLEKRYHSDSYSYIDRTEKVIIPGPFQEVRPFKNGLAAVLKNNKWGFINKTGEVVVPFEYDWAGDYSGKLAPVEKELLVGYVDGSGNVKIPFKFKDAREFSDGLAPATLDAKKWGYISESGDFVIAPIFQRAFRFDNGRALVYKDADSETVTAATDPVQLLAAARGARDAGQPNEARTACKAIIAAAPNSESAKLAQLLMTVGLPDHDLKPEIIEMNNKATYLIQTQKNKEAELLFKQILVSDPKFFTAAGAYSYLFLREKRYDEGIELLKKTLANHPSYARGYWRLGQLYAGKGVQDQAAKNFAKAKELDPYDTQYMQ